MAAQPIKRAQPAKAKTITSAVTIGQPQAMRALPERLGELIAEKHYIEMTEGIFATLMIEGVDYGNPIVNGKPIFPKPMLYKAGGELLRLYLGLQVRFEVEDKCEGDKIKYQVSAEFYDKHGVYMGGGEGVSSSMETKYRYRWLTAQQLPASEKVGMTSPFKKKDDYGNVKEVEGIDMGKWIDAHGPGTARFTRFGVQVRVDSPDVFDQENTILSQAKKRAFIDGIKTVTGASRIFLIGQTEAAAAARAKAEQTGDIVDADFSVEDLEERAAAEAPSDLVAYQQELKDAMGDMEPGEALNKLNDIMKANYDTTNIAELSAEQRKSLLGLIKNNGGVRATEDVKAEPKAESVSKPVKVSKGATRDPSSVKSVDELLKACFMDFNMQPKDVCGTLGVADRQHIVESPSKCYEKILREATQ